MRTSEDLCSRSLINAQISTKRHVLGSRIFDIMPRDVRDQCAGFRARPRSHHGFRGCDDYFDLPTNLSVDITLFESSRRIHVCEDVSAYDCLVFQEGAFIEEGVKCFAILQGFNLTPAFEKHFDSQGRCRSWIRSWYFRVNIKAKFARVIRVKMADSRRKRFSALGRRSLRGLIQNPCGVSCGMIARSDVIEWNERKKPASRRAKE
ncbi:hypothetical protein F2Q68_00033528 [Brassica cretica]|uniref:Uncharacterized protein n=1 Tax=Brassica cretica TaxID=69181 RepID=A0A8S9H248_BRACR|nr:hypothetical protein F2Q68_00033528 [Brassica cretica]